MTELQKKVQKHHHGDRIRVCSWEDKKICQLIFNYMIPTALVQLKLHGKKQIYQLQSIHCVEQMVQWAKMLALWAWGPEWKSPPKEARHGCILTTIIFKIYSLGIAYYVYNIFFLPYPPPNLLPPTPTRTPNPSLSQPHILILLLVVITPQISLVLTIYTLVWSHQHWHEQRASGHNLILG